VRLQKGEVVEILEGPPQGAGASGWFKIAPPSGEFRWVSAKYLSTEYPRDGVRVAPLVVPHPPRHDPHHDDAAGLPKGFVPSDDSSRSHARRGFPRGGRRIAAHQVGQAALTYGRGVSGGVGTHRVGAIGDGDRGADGLVVRFVARVDEPVAGPGLRRRSNGTCRLLTNKIARFEDIKQRQDAVLAMRDQTDRTSRLLTKLRPNDGEKPGSKFDVDGRFDGVDS